VPDTIYEDVRSIAEPAGALATAGLKKYIKQNNIAGENLVAIVSGANLLQVRTFKDTA
jgi:threonine dehydratase